MNRIVLLTATTVGFLGALLHEFARDPVPRAVGFFFALLAAGVVAAGLARRESPPDGRSGCGGCHGCHGGERDLPGTGSPRRLP